LTPIIKHKFAEKLFYPENKEERRKKKEERELCIQKQPQKSDIKVD
jgi:hypothetical protein